MPRAKVLPKALVADLEPVAAAHGLTLAKTTEALIVLVARGRERIPDAPPIAPSLADVAAIGSADATA